VLHAQGIAVILEAAREALDNPNATLGLSEQDSAAVRADRSTVETHNDLASATPFESKRTLGTLCHRRRSSLV
jgi:hypothetical protein